MNTKISHVQKTVNSQFSVKICALISVISAILSRILGSIYYLRSGYHAVNAPKLCIIIYTVAPILFFLYVTKFYKNFKGNLFIPIIFILMAISEFLKSMYGYDNIYVIIFRIEAVAFISAIPFSLNGFTKKTAVLIPVIARLMYLLFIFLYAEMYYIEPSVSSFFDISEFISHLSLMTGLLLFILNNRLPSVSEISSDTSTLLKMDAEEALNLLEYKLQYKKITEEEYQKIRFEIIKKL